MGLGELDLKRDKAALGPDHHQSGLAGVLSQGLLGPHLRDQAEPSGAEPWELVFDEGPEALVQMHLRGDGVSGALHAREQGLLDLAGLQQWALPVALLDPRTVDQVQMADPKFGALPQDPAQHLGSR